MGEKKIESSWMREIQLDLEKEMGPYITDDIKRVLEEVGEYLLEEASMLLEETESIEKKSNLLSGEQSIVDEDSIEDQEIVAFDKLATFREMQAEVLCGKEVVADVVAENGKTIIQKGERISIDTLEKAKLNRCMIKLIMNIQ